MKSFIKTTLTILVLFYISNIAIYFAYIRSNVLEGIETCFENADMRQVFLANNMTKQDLIKQATDTDHEIFKPVFNFAYSIGNKFLLIPSISISILSFVLYKIYKRKKRNAIDIESSTGVF